MAGFTPTGEGHVCLAVCLSVQAYGLFGRERFQDLLTNWRYIFGGQQTVFKVRLSTFKRLLCLYVNNA